MRILQVFNVPMMHVLPVGRCLAKLVGEDNFRYGAVYYPGLSERHQKLGWNCNEADPWILRLENEADKVEFERRWDEADVVFCGERLFDRMRDRLDNKKLTFYMSERWWKPPYGMARLLHPQFALMTKQFRILESSPLFHYQAIGSYAVSDMKRIAAFKDRMWKWGYFTPAPDPLPSCNRNERVLRVLWAGRMIGWKSVDILIKAFGQLLTARPDAILTLVGFGPEQNRLEKLAGKLLPPKSYEFLSPKPTSEILQLMRNADIYVLPSTGAEGWGVVINEAMSEGCAVIASSDAGAAKAMIHHGWNGMLFPTGDWKRLGELLGQLGRDDALRVQLAQEGQRTITQIWSPAVAAERFLTVCEALLAHKPVPRFADGPMAPVDA